MLGEATLALLDDETVWWGSAAAAKRHDVDWLSAHLPVDGSITLSPEATTHTIYLVAGPKARAVLGNAAPDTDWKPSVACGSEREARRSRRNGHVGQFFRRRRLRTACPYRPSRDGLSGASLAGESEGMAAFGAYAIESMRLEMGYRHWKADLITEFDRSKVPLIAL